MDDSRTLSDWLLVAASRELKGKARRVFVAKVCQSLCGGSSRKAEARFGWGRAMVPLAIYLVLNALYPSGFANHRFVV